MIYAIGDIHGKGDLLVALYNAILADIESHGDSENTIVFIGDYIDRGSQNRMVLDFLRNLEDTPNLTHVMLRGNHEMLFKEAMLNPRHPFFVKMWVNNGGAAFLQETGMDFTYFNETFPWQHYVNWMDRRLDDYYETDDYVFVHGGLDKRIERMNRQEAETLRWARFTDKDHYSDYHKMVIHGHTPNADPIVDNNRINVDTSWSYGKYPGILNLTAVVLPNRRDDKFFPPRFLQVEQYEPKLVAAKPD